jgi:hypothetical protein
MSVKYIKFIFKYFFKNFFIVKQVLSQIERVWPIEICKFDEEKFLMFLDLCNYDIFKTIFYIKNRDRIYINFIRGKKKGRKINKS